MEVSVPRVGRIARLAVLEAMGVTTKITHHCPVTFASAPVAAGVTAGRFTVGDLFGGRS